MKLIYKPTFKKRFLHFYKFYLILIAIIIFNYYMIDEYGLEDTVEYFSISIFIYGFLIFPTLYIHSTYYIMSKRDKLFIDATRELLTFKHNGNLRKFYYKDIIQIDQYKTPALIRGRTGWMPWDTYNFVVITTKELKQHVITCFLANEFILPIEKRKIKLHGVFFPYLRKSILSNDNQQSIPKIYVRKLKDKSEAELKKIIESKGSKYDIKFISAAKEELKIRQKS